MVSNGVHSDKTVVDRGICRQLLELLQENLSEDKSFDSLLHILRAFEAYSQEGEPCRLTHRQYQEYCGNTTSMTW